MGVFYDHVLIDLWPGLHGFLERHGTLRAVAKVLAYAALFFVVAIVYASYQTLDNAGWIPHSHDTPVWIQGDWLVGEYRTCGMLTRTQLTGSVRSQKVLAELPRLLCGRDWDNAGLFEFVNATTDVSEATKNALWNGGDWSVLDGYFHVFPVRYYGRIDRPETVSDSWRCQRESESLTCKALN